MTIIVRGVFNSTGNIILKHDTIPVSPVDSVSAGADQTILCSPIIYLEGSVVGGANNTFLWEQLSGDPVTIENETQLNAYCLNAGGSDLSFRLWVDKNTVNETYDDTTVVRTPTTLTRTGYGFLVNTKETAYDYDLPTWKYYADERNTTDYIFGPDLSSWPPPGDADDGLGCPDISVTDLSVSWNLPVDNYPVASQGYIDYWLERFISVVIEKYNTSTLVWDFVVEIPGEDGQRFYPIDQNETYRIGCKYDYGLFIDHLQYANSFLIVDDGSVLYKTPWSNNRTVYGDLVNRISVKRITAVTMDAPDDESMTVYGDLVATEPNVKRLTAVVIDAPDDESMTVYGDHLRGPFLIDRNFGDNIGG